MIMYSSRSSRFFEDEICSHLSEKGQKVFCARSELENHTSEGKGKEKMKERGGRKEKKRKKQWMQSSFL